MKLPDSKDYFFLEDAAIILSCKKRDLIHFGANGKLKISTRINTGDYCRIESRSGELKGYSYSDMKCWIFEEDLLGLERSSGASKMVISGFYLHPSEVADMICWNQKFGATISPDDLMERLYLTKPIYYKVKRKELFITREDLQQFIDEHSTQETTDAEPAAILKSTTPHDAISYIEAKKSAIGCSRPVCNTCTNKTCRKQIAHELFTNYGDHTPYRISLCEIGEVMGEAKPSNKGQHDALKSKIYKWKLAHNKIVTPSHHNVTP